MDQDVATRILGESDPLSVVLKSHEKRGYFRFGWYLIPLTLEYQGSIHESDSVSIDLCRSLRLRIGRRHSKHKHN